MFGNLKICSLKVYTYINVTKHWFSQSIVLQKGTMYIQSFHEWKWFLSGFYIINYILQYTQGHIVVDHLQRRTACHVWLGVYRCLLIAHLLCEYLIVAKLGVVNLYLKVIKLWLTCTCFCIYLITHYNFNSIILDK